MSIDIVALPLIGAFIGYFTNYVAIKMLFYPKKAYYLGPFRVPFTPGLIPKKRDELIDNISEVVGKKVINKQELIKYIYSRKNREFLYNYTDELVKTFLNKKLNEFGMPYRKIYNLILDWLNNHLDDVVLDFVGDFHIEAGYLVYNSFELIDKSKKVRDFLSQKQLDTINSSLELFSYKATGQIKEYLDKPQTKELIRDKIKEFLESYIDDSNILTASFVAMVAPLIEDNDKLLDQIVEKLKEFVDDKSFKTMVSDSIKRAVDEELLGLTIEGFFNRYGSGFENLKVKVAEVVQELLKKLDVEGKIKKEILNRLDKKKIAIKTVALIRLFGSKISVYDVIEFAKPGFSNKLNRYIVNNLLLLVRSQSERIFDFDIVANAKKRLSELDVGQVEDIILDISKQQFKYINFFGGVLGFLIGIVELLLR
ncbi:DUF445 family protein [Hippea jasoniae]|uniref:DUF445 family protein n=1 Tax=Hippea jasoniae TaxID=944479 RepID=UPI00054F0BEA|nr:DUF445 family protein [Hippea jasoniae]